tara:strand:+ start:1720 stop:2076 length:357 start_codon:yes stop_codon:yes gene_type:complete
MESASGIGNTHCNCARCMFSEFNCVCGLALWPQEFALMNSQFLSALEESSAGETFCALTEGVRNKDAAIKSAATRILTYTRRVMPRDSVEKPYKSLAFTIKFEQIDRKLAILLTNYSK